jgi:hypothetical protein
MPMDNDAYRMIFPRVVMASQFVIDGSAARCNDSMQPPDRRPPAGPHQTLMKSQKTACDEAIAPLHGEIVFGNVRADWNREAPQRRNLRAFPRVP